MTEEEQQEEEHENKRIRPRERALGQKYTCFTSLADWNSDRWNEQ